MTTYGETQFVEISKLKLDPENPRLPESKKGGSQIELAVTLDLGFDAFTVAELMASHGYFASEPMIVIPDKNEEGFFVVVEGNRRLTAVKGLTDSNLRSQFLEPEKWNEIAKKCTLKSSDKLPVVLAKDRISVAPVIGTKHIGGILQWKPYPQARYIADLVDKYGMKTDEVAAMIGMQKNVVADLYREQAIAAQAKEMGIETGNLESAFSLLTVAMKISKIREHVGAPTGTSLTPGAKPIPENKKEELRETLRFIFGADGVEPVISDSRQISSLANCIASPAGLAVLRSGKSLEEAKQKIASSALSPMERLTNRLTAGKNALTAASDDIASFNGEANIKELITEIDDALTTLRNVVDGIDT